MKVPLTPIPFDAEKLKEGYTIKTRDGREVKQVTAFDVKNSSHPVWGVLDGHLTGWAINGSLLYGSVDIDPRDLVMYPPDSK